MGERVFVSGPTGAVGVALINCLINYGYEVTALCRKNSLRISQIPVCDQVKIVECDLSELGELSKKELGNGKYFFHLAWEGTNGKDRENVEMQMKNVRYTVDSIDLASRLGCEKFIGAGSQAEYGIANEKLSSETRVNPVSAYGAGKLSAFFLGKIRAEQLRMKFNWVRILSVYGPNDGCHTLIMSAIEKMSTGKDIELTAGTQKWDYLYCDDAARGLYLVAEKGKNQKAYVLGSGNSAPLKQFILTMEEVIPTHSKLLWGRIPYTGNSVMYLCADSNEIYQDTGFEPIISFREGIRKTWQWYKENRGI